MTFIIVSMIYVVGMVFFSSSTRTCGLWCAGYLFLLGASVSYDGGNEWWKFLLFLTGVATVAAGFSLRHDRKEQEMRDWMDDIKMQRGPAQEQINDE